MKPFSTLYPRKAFYAPQTVPGHHFPPSSITAIIFPGRSVLCALATVHLYICVVVSDNQLFKSSRETG